MKHKLTLIIVLILIITLCSCTSKNAMKDAKNYLDNYYQNLNSNNTSKCFYQLNKNSYNIIKEKYNIDAESFLSVRPHILGKVLNYEILEETLKKDGDVKVVDLSVKVEYQNATIDENVQITIEKDGQTSINIIEFGEDNVINSLKDKYINTILSNDINSIKDNISQYYYKRKTERNLEEMVNQTNNLGGKLNGYNITQEKLIYEKIDNGAFVYEAMIQIDTEKIPLMNKIKIFAQEGNVGIGYTVILPEKILLFLSQYQSLLNEENKDALLALYSNNLWGNNEDKKDLWWNRLLAYSEEFGKLQGFNVTSMGLDKLSDVDGNEFDVMRLVVNMEYEEKIVKNTFVLLDGVEHKIYDQQFSD